MGLSDLGLWSLFTKRGIFFAARACGIEVEVFSVGWGRKLIGFRKGNTEYRISMIPLGGFAKMKGESAYRDAISEGHTRIQPEPHSFFSATPLQRIFVAAAGPGMNLLFAVICFSIINLVGYEYASFPNKIILSDDFPQYYTLPADETDAQADEQAQPPTSPSPAARAGLRSGDHIIAVNGIEIENFNRLQQEISPRALEEVTLSIERGGTLMQTSASLTLNNESGSGILGVFPYIEPIISQPHDAQPDETASFSLQPGDRIVMINGQDVNHIYDIQVVLDSIPVSREQSFVQLNIERDGSLRTIQHPLLYEEGEFSLGYYFQQDTYKKQSAGLLQAISRGWKETISVLTTTVKGIGLLFRGLDAHAALSGPLRITVLVGEVTAQSLQSGIAEGLRAFFYLLSLISVALAFGNLLPIPILDGGQILISLVELCKRSPVSPKMFLRYQTVGVTIVIGLIVFVLFNDLLFILGRA
ncbi:MAG: site-2 protease family protein [Salinispira sp.]